MKLDSIEGFVFNKSQETKNVYIRCLKNPNAIKYFKLSQ